ncbi:hypothetical protein PACTADRAFT_51511 [Pachysolen tannophilus NRRL Y-2460]|uniref:Uncharacterized protein n=1 Tax=Pachysolen tannophilus NRRL Y-2460 TaxID=669874 RepID=A0A1E4TPR9_PACTA|nr:hypothetical protein PACTADRAFT_51511 [Pachysolen tannophilus NRRL Y-2460]
MISSLLLILYSTVIVPLISIVILHQVDEKRYNEFKDIGYNYVHGLLGSAPVESKVSYEEYTEDALKYVYANSSLVQFYEKYIKTNKYFVKYTTKVMEFVKPYYDIYIKPHAIVAYRYVNSKYFEIVEPAIVSSYDYIKTKYEIFVHPSLIFAYGSIRPKYEDYILPNLLVIKEKYQIFFEATLINVNYYYATYLASYVDDYWKPFYAEHYKIFENVFGHALNLLIGFLIFKFFEKPILKILNVFVEDAYDVSESMDKRFEKESNFKKIPQKSLDDTASSSSSNFLGGQSKKATSHEDKSFLGDSTTEVDIERARPAFAPDSNKNSKKKTTTTTTTTKQKSYSNGSSNSSGNKQQQKKVIRINGNLYNEGPHVGSTVQVQIIDDHDDIEISEEIEDELNDEKKYYQGLEETTDTEPEVDSSGLDSEAENKRIIAKAVQSISDDSSSSPSSIISSSSENILESTPIKKSSYKARSLSSSLKKPALPKMLSPISSGSIVLGPKYNFGANSGIFYSPSKNAIIKTTIPKSCLESSFFNHDIEMHDNTNLNNDKNFWRFNGSHRDRINDFKEEEDNQDASSTGSSLKAAIAAVTQENIYINSTNTSQTDAFRKTSSFKDSSEIKRSSVESLRILEDLSSSLNSHSNKG